MSTNALAALVLGIVLLVIAYTVPQLPPPVRTLLLVLGWILTILGALFVVLELVGAPLVGLR